MKKSVIAIISIIPIVLGFVALSGHAKRNEGNDVYRMHIRANSNSASDQYIKYFIKDKILEFVSPILNKISTAKEARLFLNNSKNVIEEYANYLLKTKNINYCANVNVGINYFEEKEIDGKIFPSGNYESMIVMLGEAKGNNWWGLVYPSFSFFPINGTDGSQNIYYKSKIVEIYNRIAK